MQNSTVLEVRRELARRELAKRSPMMFLQHLQWPLLEPDTKFTAGWFHEYLDDILLAAAERKLKKIVVNIAPRSGKSTLCSVAFPCFLWTKHPSTKFIHISHSYSLSMLLAEQRLTVLQSEAYHSIVSDGFCLLTNRKKEILNTNRGFMAVCNASKVTGIGSDYIILDDFQSSQDAQSNVIRESSNLMFENSIMTRLNDKMNGVILIIMQRLHQHDLSGYLKSESANFGFEYFTIKAEETCDQKYFFPYSGKVLQRYEGDLLHPKRESREYVEQLKKSVKVWTLQYQQDDTAISSDVFSDDNFSHHDTIPQIEYRILSIDTATTNSPTSSRWCFTLFGSEHKSLFKAKNGDWTLMDCYAEKFVYTEGRDVLAQYIHDNKVDLVLIEKKSSGQDLLSDLNDYNSRRGFNKVKVEGILPIRDKLTRAYLAVPYCDTISIPSDCNEPWFKEWKAEVLNFPSTYDDRVDTLTQFIRWLKFDEKDTLTTHKTELLTE